MTYVTGHTVLNKEQEISLISNIQNKGKNWKKDLHTMIIHNVDYVWFTAKKIGVLKFHLEHKDDIIQCGMMGLLKAIEKFDVDAGFRFSTYAGQWVRNGITRAYQKGEFNLAVSNPVHIAKIKYQLNRISKIHNVNIDNCYDMYVLDCERQEIQCLHGKATVKAAYELMTCSFISGDVNYTEYGETVSLFDNIECKQDSIDSTVIINSDKKQLDCMLNKLTPKEKDVLVRRFGLGCEEQTLDCIGQMHGCTRERIRQIQNIALNKLKKIYKKEDINCMLDL